MRLLLGITGSVAAILTPKLVAAITDRYPDIELKVIATERGQYFFRQRDVERSVQVGQKTVRRGVMIMHDKDEWPEDGYAKGKPVPHIDLGDWANMLLIAPLTADTLSDIAHGKADKFLTSVVLAWPLDKPLIVAPAMNTRMWENPITQTNLQTVRLVYQARVIPPIEGNLACGTTGVGAMAKIENIVAALTED